MMMRTLRNMEEEGVRDELGLASAPYQSTGGSESYKESAMMGKTFGFEYV